MATHSSTLAWKIPWTEEPGGLQSEGSLRVGHDWATSEKEMATHSSVLAWRIPGTADPGGLPSVGLHRVGHDWSDLAVAAVSYQDLNLDLFDFWQWMCFASLCYLYVQFEHVLLGITCHLWILKWKLMTCLHLEKGEIWVRSLGWEDPLEKGKATHSSILAWKIPWTV